MNLNRIIADLRRCDGDVTYALRLIAQFAAGLEQASVEWLLRPDQTQSVPAENRLGLALPSDAKWNEFIVRHIRDIHGSTQNAEVRYWVLSFDNAVLLQASILALDGLPVSAKHIGSLFPNNRVHLAAPKEATEASPAQREMSDAEVSELVRSFLQQGGYTSRENALSQKALRPRLSARHPSVARRQGDPKSQSLMRRVISNGTAAGWLVSYQAVPGKSGTEFLYLNAAVQKPVNSALTSPRSDSQAENKTTDNPCEAPSVAGVSDRQSQRKEKAAGFRKALDGIGSIPRTREFLLDALENIVGGSGYVPLLISEILPMALPMAQSQAAADGYEDEKNWPAAANCVMRLLLRSHVLLDPQSNTIEDRIGKDTKRIAKLIADFRLEAEAFSAEMMIGARPAFNYDDDTYYIGLTLYRQGGGQQLSQFEIRAKADRLLEYLEQDGRIQLESDRTITLKTRVRRPSPTVVRV